MDIFRVIKNGNYCTMSNSIHRRNDISMKAKAVLTLIFTLSDSWDFSVKGITGFFKEGRDTVYSAIRELEDKGYCDIRREVASKGQFGKVFYTFYEESPEERESHKNEYFQGVSPRPENPDTDNPDTENKEQRSTNTKEVPFIRSTYTKKEKNKKEKRDSEIEDLDPKLFPDAIRDFSPSNSPAKGQYHPEGDSGKNPGVVPKKRHVSDELWRTDFEEYKKCLFNAMNEILKDAEYVSSRERYFNNIDVRLTLDKSIRDFWGTEDGWLRKKKTTKGTPNWITTLKNSFEMNKVYKPRVFGAPQEPVASPTRQKINL